MRLRSVYQYNCLTAYQYTFNPIIQIVCIWFCFIFVKHLYCLIILWQQILNQGLEKCKYFTGRIINRHGLLYILLYYFYQNMQGLLDCICILIPIECMMRAQLKYIKCMPYYGTQYQELKYKSNKNDGKRGTYIYNANTVHTLFLSFYPTYIPTHRNTHLYYYTCIHTLQKKRVFKAK